MILEIAIGDAYGAGFEFVKDSIIEEEHKMEKYLDSRIDNIKAGEYTDDTQMTIAIAELLLNEEVWSKELIAKYFLNTFNRDPIQGYASGFYKFLLQTENENDFLNNIITTSTRNGAAMRSVPLGYIKDKEKMLEKAEMQASVTHNTKEGILSSKAVALSAYYFKNKLGNKDGLFEYICNETGHNFNNHKTSRTQCCGMETVDAILTILPKASSIYELIDLSIKLGGDTDSVASIVCGIASLSDEYDKSLPEFFVRDLTNGQFGKDYIINLDNKLKEKFL